MYIHIYIHTPIEPQHVEELNMFLIELTVGLMASQRYIVSIGV